MTHMATQKLYLSSHPLYLTLHPLYLCHQTQGVNCITPTRCMTLHTICMTPHSVCMTSHEHVMTSHPYRYDIIASIFMTSYAIYMISPILFHENKTMIPGISPTVFDNTASASVWSHPFHQWLHNSYGSLHTWHTYHTHPTSHQIQTSWYQSSVFRTSQTLHSWHQISYITLSRQAPSAIFPISVNSSSLLQVVLTKIL